MNAESTQPELLRQRTQKPAPPLQPAPLAGVPWNVAQDAMRAEAVVIIAGVARVLAIFELYTRIDRDPNTRNSRTSRGVGLAFCKLALAAHGGDICVEDHVGGGSLFRCRWPI